MRASGAPIADVDGAQLYRVRLFIEQSGEEVAALDRSARGESRIATIELMRIVEQARRMVLRMRAEGDVVRFSE